MALRRAMPGLPAAAEIMSKSFSGALVDDLILDPESLDMEQSQP